MIDKQKKNNMKLIIKRILWHIGKIICLLVMLYYGIKLLSSYSIIEILKYGFILITLTIVNKY